MGNSKAPTDDGSINGPIIPQNDEGVTAKFLLGAQLGRFLHRKTLVLGLVSTLIYADENPNEDADFVVHLVVKG